MMTLKQQQALYNKLVRVAHALGLVQFRHHTSTFESFAKGDKQTIKITRAILAAMEHRTAS
jgi:hypothetical protein